MNRLETLGMNKSGLLLPDGQELDLCVLPGKTDTAILHWQGYGQTVDTWAPTFAGLAEHGCSDTIITVERGMKNGRSLYTAGTSLKDQRREMQQIVEALNRHPVIRDIPHLHNVGHSDGGVLARMGIENFHSRFGNLMQIAPVPERRFAIIRNRDFFKYGGIEASLATIPAWFRRDQGFRVPKRVMEGLFTGPISQEAMEQYLRDGIRDDGVRMFYDLALGDVGGQLAQAKKDGWKGKHIMVICRQDHLMNLEFLVEDVIRSDAYTFTLQAPHCYWFAPEDNWVPNLCAAYKMLGAHF